MLIIIPFLAFYFIFLNCYRRPSKPEDSACWRDAYLSASIIWGIILTVITEFLSTLSLITLNWVLLSWGLVCITSAIIYYRLNRTQKLVIRFRLSRIWLPEIMLSLGIVFITITIGLIALIAPPNHWDSMIYHMPRVFHWIQNHNVNYYPTHIMNQLTFTPGAEFIIMHLQILSNSDRFANLVQWLFMLGSIIGISAIAKELGADIRSQVFSAVICATIPMGILQGSSTQNDYAVAFWIVCLVYYILVILKNARINLSLLFKIGASLGLALLTKGAAYIYAFPFLVWFIFSGFKKFRWYIWGCIFIIATVAFCVNLGYYIRNFSLIGSLFPSAQLPHVSYGITSLSLLISNVIRNIALHTGTPFVLINRIIYGAIKLIHDIVGINLNDPLSTAHCKFYIPFSLNENQAGNLIHLFFIMVSIAIFLISRQKRQRQFAYYLTALASAFFIFSFFVKWEPWNQRYHLPIFVLFCPFTAVVLSRINNPFRQNKTLLITMCIIFLCTVTGWVLYHSFKTQITELLYNAELIINKAIKRENIFSPQPYFDIANSQFRWFLGTSVFLIFVLFFLYRFKDIVISISFIFILASLPWVLHNDSRKIVGKKNIFTVKRIEQYFADRPHYKNPYTRIINYIKSKGHSDIGIILDDDYLDHNWEYPFIALLQENNLSRFRLEHINVSNNSSIKYGVHPFNEFIPSAIISLHPAESNKIIYKNTIYLKEWPSNDTSCITDWASCGCDSDDILINNLCINVFVKQ